MADAPIVSLRADSRFCAARVSQPSRQATVSTLMLGPTIDALGAAGHRVVPQPANPRDSSSAERTETLTVKLGAWAYPLAWAGIYALHAACATYCFAAGMLFQTIQSTLVAFYLDFYQFTVPTKYSRTIAKFHFVIGAVHCSFLAMAIIRFIYRGGVRVYKLCRGSTVVQPSDRTTSSLIEPVTSAIPLTLERRIPWQLRKPVMFVYEHVFGRSGLLGVEFRHVDAFFLLREIVETMLQSYQAYQMCQLLTRPALNRFYVATLVINCWATPVLHHVVPNKALQRLLVRLCDVVLDFVASVGVPAILAVTYVRTYDPTVNDFPYELYYDDKWFVNALKESPLIMFGSWIDAVGRLTFSIGLITTLDDVKLLLKRGPGVSIKSAAAKLKRLSTKKLRLSRPLTPKWYNTERSRVVTIAHRLMFLYGFVVLGVHLQAELRPSPMESCLLEVRPWLVSKPACSLVEVNCWRNHELTGNAEDFERNVGGLDALSLTQITFRHCPQVAMLSSVAYYKNMIGIKFYNSTLVTWEDQAALRESHHAVMRFIFFVRTNFTNGTFPPGLISPEFPLLLRDLEFSITNLHWIPDDLDKRWPPGIALCLEFSKLTEYPLTFARARFDSITLIGNKIKFFPVAFFEAPDVGMFSIAGNPVTELPVDVNASRIVRVGSFAIDATDIKSVPPWVGEWIGTTRRSVSAGRTPWCEEVVLKANESEQAAKPWLKRIRCKDPGTLGVYPLYVDERPEEVW